MTHYTHQTVPTQFVDAGGIRFAYRRFGNPGTVPLIKVALLGVCLQDMPLPIGFDKTISQPFIVALMTDLLAQRSVQGRLSVRRRVCRLYRQAHWRGRPRLPAPRSRHRPVHLAGGTSRTDDDSAGRLQHQKMVGWRPVLCIVDGRRCLHVISCEPM